MYIEMRARFSDGTEIWEGDYECFGGFNDLKYKYEWETDRDIPHDVWVEDLVFAEEYRKDWRYVYFKGGATSVERDAIKVDVSRPIDRILVELNIIRDMTNYPNNKYWYGHQLTKIIEYSDQDYVSPIDSEYQFLNPTRISYFNLLPILSMESEGMLPKGHYPDIIASDYNYTRLYNGVGKAKSINSFFQPKWLEGLYANDLPYSINYFLKENPEIEKPVQLYKIAKDYYEKFNSLKGDMEFLERMESLYEKAFNSYEEFLSEYGSNRCEIEGCLSYSLVYDYLIEEEGLTEDDIIMLHYYSSFIKEI